MMEASARSGGKGHNAFNGIQEQFEEKTAVSPATGLPARARHQLVVPGPVHDVRVRYPVNRLVKGAREKDRSSGSPCLVTRRVPAQSYPSSSMAFTISGSREGGS